MTQFREQLNQSITQDPSVKWLDLLEALENTHTHTHTITYLIENNYISLIKGT